MPLRDRNILVVEHTPVIAFDLEWLLTSASTKVLGPATTVASGIAIIRSAEIDAAVLSVNTTTRPAFAVAHRLQAKKIPFVFLSTHADDVIPAHLRSVPFIPKPYVRSELLGTLVNLLSRRN